LSLRIVHIIDSGGFYGAEAMLLTLCEAQLRQGLDVEVISIGRPGNYEKAIETRLLERNIPCKIWRMPPWPDIRVSMSIYRWCASTHTHIIHSHGYKGNILMGLLPRRFRRIPVVSTMHGYTIKRGFSLLNVKYWVDKKILRRLDALVMVSSSMKQQVGADRWNNRVHVIPNGISRLAPLDDTHNYPEVFSLSGPKIVSMGRLSIEKNFGLLISAMVGVLKKIHDAKLVIFGEGKERVQLEAQISDLGLNDHVFLPGYIDQPAIIFKKTDVFINCSTTEGMPVTLLEAMREGCLIAATDIPANRVLLESLTPPPPLTPLLPDALADAIAGLLLLNDDEKRNRKQNAMEYFRSNFTDDIMAERYFTLYEQLFAST